MDDRILLVPQIWAADPDVTGTFPAVKAFADRLRHFWPVDFLRHPTLKGEERTGSGWRIEFGAYSRALTEQHHVVIFMGASEPDVAAIAPRPPRSLVNVGFFASPATLTAIGHPDLAAIMQAVFQSAKHPAQVLRGFMEEADEVFISEQASALAAAIDLSVLSEFVDEARATDFRPIGPIAIPALYIDFPRTPPGPGVFFELFRSYVPGVRHDKLETWGPRLHEEEGGHELAGKVIPFIEEVIASGRDR